jgi:hypothetical protein
LKVVVPLFVPVEVFNMDLVKGMRVISMSLDEAL